MAEGTKVAVEVSYTWDEGETGPKNDSVGPWSGVRMVEEEAKVRFVCLFLSYLLPCRVLVRSFFCTWRTSSYFMCQSALMMSLIAITFHTSTYFPISFRFPRSSHLYR